MIEIYLDNINCTINGELDNHILEKLDQEMSYNHPGYSYMQGGRGGFGLGGKYGGWDGKVRLLTKSMKFPIGLLRMAGKILKDAGIEFRVYDRRPAINYGEPLPIISEKFQLRDYQQDVIDKAIKKGSGIIRVATGGGKTSIIAALAAQYNVPTVVYVIGIELLYQMKETIERIYGVPCGVVGDGKCELDSQITIMTIWSAAAAFDKKADIIENDITQDNKVKLTDKSKALIRDRVQKAQLFIFDECQYAASETLQFLHKASTSAKHRFLLSGTPWRDSGDDILIEAVSGPKFADINATQLIEEGYLVPPDIHFVNVPVIRNVGKNYHDVYRNYIVENDDRNDLIVKAARKLVSAGRKVLILVVRVNHGDVLMEKLQDEFRVKFLDGAKSTADRMDSIQGMKDGKIDILIASKIFDQGVDIPELDALILAGSGKSSGRALQRIGRVIRGSPGKKKAIVVEFYDNCKYLKDHSEARIKVYKSEKGFNIIMPKNQVLHSYPKREPVKWM
jgi:superfamily II DNA or RNA helicase